MSEPIEDDPREYYANLEGAGVRKQESEGRPSLEQLQRAYATAYLDFSMADAEVKRLRNQEIAQYWKLMEDRNNPELIQEHERLREAIANAERKRDEISKSEKVAVEGIADMSEIGVARGNIEAANRFIVEELKRRISADPQSIKNILPDNPEMARLVDQAKALDDGIRRKLEELPTDQSKPY